MTTNGKDWSVETRYRFLRWEDIVRKDFVRPAWWKILSMFYAMFFTIVSGTWLRLFKAHWRFGLFVIYPLLLTLTWIALGVVIGTFCLKLVGALGAPAFARGVVGIVTGIGAFASACGSPKPKTYLLYMCDDIVATYQFAQGRRPDWDERMEEFAGYVDRRGA